MQAKYETSDIQPVVYKYLLETLALINQNYGKRFFYYWDAPGETIIKNTPSIFINSTYFECIGLSNFRLKPDKSASKALDSILFENKHIIDCTSAIILAQYNALRMTLIHFVGKEQGEKRFDFLFGSETGSPQACRMLISVHSPLAAYAALTNSDETILGINPLLSFINFTHEVQSQKSYTLSMLKVGQFCHIKGHPDYQNKHREGMGGGINVLVCEDNKFMAFAYQAKPIDYNTILKGLSDRYNTNPIIRSDMTTSLPKSSSAKDMIGFLEHSVTCFLYGQISYVLSHDAFSFPFFSMLKVMNNYLEKVKKLLPINKPKNTTIPSFIEPISNEEIHRRLRQLAACKDTKTLENFFEQYKIKLDINASDNNPEKGHTALHLAVINKKFENAAFLLKNNASYHLKNKLNKTVVDYLLEIAHTPAAQDILLIIKKHILTLHEDPSYALRLFADQGEEEKLKVLIHFSSNINQKGEKTGQTALHRAAGKGHLNCVILLMDAEADPTIIDQNNKRPIDYALKFPEIQELLSRSNQLSLQLK